MTRPEPDADPEAVDAYIAACPPAVQGLLRDIRAAVQRAAPQAVECIRYRIPTVRLHGNLVHYAAFRGHVGLYPGDSAIAAFRDALAPYPTSAGTVRFPLDAPIPVALVEEIVRFRVDEDRRAATARRAPRHDAAWPDIVTFDCYGTLVQWPETLRAVFRTLVATDVEAARFHQDFGAWHVRLKAGPYRPYGTVLREALAGTMGQWGLSGVPQAQARLLEAVRAIPPYPDVVPALRTLARRHRLAVVSNSEDALIADTVRGLGVPLEVVTAEQVEAYKPDPAFFARAFTRLGVARDDVLHVGAGLATDMAPAFALGLARVWIDRRGDPPDPDRPPTAVLPDLSRLARTITTLARRCADRQ